MKGLAGETAEILNQPLDENMRIWIQKISGNDGTPDTDIEELLKDAIDIAMIKGREKVVVVMILPDKYDEKKHHWE